MSVKQELTVAGRFENLAKISDFVGQLATQANFGDKASYAIQMAVDEACTNIIEHAYGGEGDGQIRLSCRPAQDGLEVTIYDQGVPYEMPQTPPLDTQAPLEKRQNGGMGLFFIYSLVDKVEFKAGTPEGNRLVLFKRREQTA